MSKTGKGVVLQYGTKQGPYDPSSSAPVVSDNKTRAIHEGRAWKKKYIFTLPASGSYTFLLEVPAGVILHIPARGVTAGGDNITINRFRNSIGVTGTSILFDNAHSAYADDTQPFTISHTPTGVTDGDDWGSDKIIDTGGAPAFGGSNSADEEDEDLFTEGKYVLRFTNGEASDVEVRIKWLFFKEQTS